MHDLSLLDETLDINITKSYYLSIQIDLNGFSFCLLDTIRNKYVALKHFSLDHLAEDPGKNIRAVFEQDEFLKREFKGSKMIYTTRQSTLVPEPLFNKENVTDYFSFNHSLDNNNYQIFFNRLKHAEVYAVFAVPEHVISVVQEYLPSVKIFHQSVPLIENIFLNRRNRKDQLIAYLNISDKLFDIVVIDDKKLNLHNCFSFQDENDLLYFTLYVFEQQKLDPGNTEIILSGRITKTMKQYEVLRKYIRHIRFDTPNTQFTYSYTFNDIPSHTYLNLLNLYPCE
jgi:hypothetical protein